jgi:hypothetical protein
MEHVLQWMAEVKIPYDRRRTSVVRRHNGARFADEELRRVWLKRAQALFETRKPDMNAKIAWLTLSTRYLAADRVSVYLFDHGNRDRTLHRQASEIFALGRSERQRGGRP